MYMHHSLVTRDHSQKMQEIIKVWSDLSRWLLYITVPYIKIDWTASDSFNKYSALIAETGQDEHVHVTAG